MTTKETIFYTSPEHRERLLSTLQRLDKLDGGIDREYAAALYLLTAHDYLWEIARKHVRSNGISIAPILPGLSSGEKILVKLAGNLFNGRSHIEPVEFTILDTVNFELALSAIRLRCGLGEGSL